jgi:peptide/nickel transport system permease protein
MMLSNAVAMRSVPDAVVRVLVVLRAMANRPSGLLGLIIVAAHVLIALFAGVLATHDFARQDATAIFSGPSADHLLGTDNLGRDVYSRTLLGGRMAIVVTLLGTMIALTLGGLGGITLGVVRGKLDEIAMRIVDAFLAIPWLLMLLLIIAVIGNSAPVMILTLGVLYAVPVIRVVRSATMVVVSQDYVTAARLRGHSTWSLVRNEVLPNVLDVVLVEGGMRWSWMLLTFSGLSFLGFGVAPPTPDWGVMVASGRNYLAASVWPVIPPMVALSTLIVGLNLSADALAKALGVDRAGRLS